MVIRSDKVNLKVRLDKYIFEEDAINFDKFRERLFDWAVGDKVISNIPTNWTLSTSLSEVSQLVPGESAIDFIRERAVISTSFLSIFIFLPSPRGWIWIPRRRHSGGLFLVQNLDIAIIMMELNSLNRRPSVRHVHQAEMSLLPIHSRLPSVFFAKSHSK